MAELQNRVKALESSSRNNAEELANNTIKELVRQLSNTSKKSVEVYILIFIYSAKIVFY